MRGGCSGRMGAIFWANLTNGMFLAGVKSKTDKCVVNSSRCKSEFEPVTVQQTFTVKL